MFKNNLRFLVVVSSVLLLGVGCNNAKVLEQTPVGNNVPAAENNITTTEKNSTVAAPVTPVVEVKKAENKPMVAPVKKMEATQPSVVAPTPKDSAAPTIEVKTPGVVSGTAPTVVPEAIKSTPKTVAVTIANYAFSPEIIKIKVGDTIKWTNTDDAPHKIASNPRPTHTDLPGLVSGVLSTGDSFSFTFDKAGTFGYYCMLHPSMIGEVVVE